MGVIKVNAEVAENYLKPLVEVCDEMCSSLTAFREDALDVASLCGNALQGVIDRLTEKEPGSLTTLSAELSEQSEILRNDYIKFASSMKVMDDVNINMEI